MTPELKYERIGKLIYGSRRYGAEIADIHNWMADDLGLPRPNENDSEAQANLLTAYVDKYTNDEDFNDNLQRFVEIIKLRSAQS